MRKEELRKLRTLNATKEMMEKAARNDQKRTINTAYGTKKVTERKYAIFMRCQHLGAFLKVAIFIPEEMQKGVSSPHYEIFFNPEGGEYLTREWNDGKEVWRTSKICNLKYAKNNDWNYLYYSEHYSWINRDGSNSIKKVLDVKKGGYEGILEYQEKVAKEKLEEKRRRETKPWDDDMALIPELPKGFDRWQKKEGNPEHFIFYKYKKGGVKVGYCSYCEKEVDIVNPKHGKQGKCPRCRKQIVYKATGRIKTLDTKEHKCQIVQKIKGGFVVRTFNVWKNYYRTTYDKPNYRGGEVKRTLYQGSHIVEYDYELYKNTQLRWVRCTALGIAYSTAKVYSRNLKSLEISELKYSALPIMIREKRMFNCNAYLMAERGNPTVEKLVKIGMYRMAEEMVGMSYMRDLLNESETVLAKMLKIDTSRLKRLKGFDSGIKHLQWMQMEKRSDTVLPDELIKYFGNEGILPGDLKFIISKMGYRKIHNYLMRQQAMTKETAKQILTTWKDYLNMAVKAKMNTSHEMIYRPKNLKSEHSEVILLLQEDDMKKLSDELSKKWPLVDDVCKTLKKYELQGEVYSIVAPKGIMDIVKEGTALHHCIHTCDFYFDRISTKESYLLFLRWTDSIDVPYYTLEIEPNGNIRQKRTTGDNQNEDFKAAVKWLKKWQKEIKKRLTKEDIELAEKSNELRIKEFEELRKKGNKIWHGKLAGKLLVDVLEEDFMAVEEAKVTRCG